VILLLNIIKLKLAVSFGLSDIFIWPAAALVTDEVKDKIIDLAKSRSVFKKDLQHIVDLYSKDFSTTTKPKNPEFKIVFDSFVRENVEWSPENIHDTIKSISEALGVKMGKVMPDLRMAICGGVSGPDLPTSMWILGKDESNKRILSMIS
jgi:glutamyl/glutaminyl-tRNA synthetase